MKKRTFLFLNIDGDFLSIAQRVAEEGYEVYSWYDPELKPKHSKTGCGIIEIVSDMFDVLNDFQERKEDLIILIDDNSYGDMCTYLRKEGWKVIGSSQTADHYEHDREAGNELASKLGLALPITKSFTDFASGKQYLIKAKKAGDGKFFFKGDGIDLAGGAKTYGSQNADDMMRFLDWIEKDQMAHHYRVERYELQTMVDGIEVDFSSYFNGEKFLPELGITYEQKRIHGLGAAQGCTGQIFCFADPRQEPYFEHLRKLLPEIQGSVPTEWAINNIIASDGHLPHFLEFTPRFGWDCTYGELALLVEAGRSIGEFFIMLAEGKSFPKDYFPYGRYSAAVRLFSEGIGTEGEEVKGKPIFWLPEKADHFWLNSIRLTDEGIYEITDNPIGVAVACGDTVEEAVAAVYDLINPKNGYLVTPDIFYSETIGEGVSENIRKLEEWGILGSYQPTS